jgi:hypothetical protein
MRVFENWILRRIFGSKRDEVTGNWRKLHNEELVTCTICQLRIMRMMMSRRMRCAGHVAYKIPRKLICLTALMFKNTTDLLIVLAEDGSMC